MDGDLESVTGLLGNGDTGLFGGESGVLFAAGFILGGFLGIGEKRLIIGPQKIYTISFSAHLF